MPLFHDVSSTVLCILNREPIDDLCTLLQQCLVYMVLQSWFPYSLCPGVNVFLSHCNAKEWSYLASFLDVAYDVNSVELPNSLVPCQIDGTFSVKPISKMLSDLLYGLSNILFLLLLILLMA